MFKEDKEPPHISSADFGRRLFLFQTLALISGCHSLTTLPKIPFLDKESERSEPLFRVNGYVREIATTSNWRYMFVRYQTQTWRTENINDTQETQNNALALYNIEFQTPIPCSDTSLEEQINPFDAAFNQKGSTCLVASGFKNGQSKKASSGITVEKINLSPKKEENEEPFFLTSEEWIDVVLSSLGDWIAPQFTDGHWEFLDITSNPPKRVVFPEKYESKGGERKTKITRVLKFSPDGKLAAVLMAPLPESPSKNQTISIWDISTARTIPEEKAKKLPLEALFVSEFLIRDTSAGNISAFSPDGQMIAVRTKQKYVGIWQIAGDQISEFGEHRQPITSIRFSQDNTKLAVGTGEEFGRLVLWDVRKGRLLRTYDSPDRASRKITAIDFSPDGNLIYFGDDRGGVHQWDYQTQITKTDKKKD